MDPVTKCSLAGCQSTAKWQAIIKLWADVTPKPERIDHNCLEMITSVIACDAHKGDVKAEHFFTPEGRARILTGTDRAGVAAPDFDSALLEMREIVGKPIDPNKMAKGLGQVYHA